MPSSVIMRASLAAVAVWLCGAATAVAAPMTFSLQTVGDPRRCARQCPQIIVAQGEILQRTPDDFVAFVKAQTGNGAARAVVLLDSQGGRVGASIALGQMFRAAGAAVVVGRVGPNGVVSGRCYSACVYALLGGRKRVVPRESRLGVHRMFAYETGGGAPDDVGRASRVYATSDLVARIGDYVAHMGVSRELVYAAERVPPERVRVLTPQEIRRWRVGVEKF